MWKKKVLAKSCPFLPKCQAALSVTAGDLHLFYLFFFFFFCTTYCSIFHNWFIVSESALEEATESQTAVDKIATGNWEAKQYYRIVYNPLCIYSFCYLKHKYHYFKVVSLFSHLFPLIIR